VRIFFPFSPSLINNATGFQNVISHILKAMPPADSAKSSNYTKSQITYSIYDGRYKANKPRTSVAPPVQLFNPVFGHFLDVVKSNDALPDDIIRKTTEYMKAASAIYAIHQFLVEISKGRRNSGELKREGEVDTGAAALLSAVRCASGGVE
jgi:hypothetical protein